MSRRHLTLASALYAALAATSHGQTPAQPRVAPGPSEPDWVAILDVMYGTSQFGDLANPVLTTVDATPALFRKAGPGPVRYQPLVALGLETMNRGGWYRAGDDLAQPDRHELWSYRFKNTGRDLETGQNLPPPLAEGSATEFDPGEEPFGLWLANDGLDDGGVFTQPAVVRAVNSRLAPQPYKAMIYPYRDVETGEVVPGSYLIGWEYSTNDDFQDVVCRVDNVELLPAATSGE